MVAENAYTSQFTTQLVCVLPSEWGDWLIFGPEFEGQNWKVQVVSNSTGHTARL